MRVEDEEGIEETRAPRSRRMAAAPVPTLGKHESVIAFAAGQGLEAAA